MAPVDDDTTREEDPRGVVELNNSRQVIKGQPRTVWIRGIRLVGLVDSAPCCLAYARRMHVNSREGRERLDLDVAHKRIKEPAVRWHGVHMLRGNLVAWDKWRGA